MAFYSKPCYLFQFSSVSKYKASFRINSPFDWHVLKFFHMSPQRAMLKKIRVPAFLRIDRIQRFSVYATTAFDLIKDWNKDENSRSWRFIASSVTFCFKFCAGSKYCLKASFRINSLFDWQKLKIFRMSPQTTRYVKKSLCSLSCLLTEFIDF